MASFLLKSSSLCTSFTTLRRMESLAFVQRNCGYSSMIGKNILELEFGESRMKFSSGGIGRIADGGVIAEIDGTSVLVTAVSENIINKDLSGLPLIVDYRETASAAGRIPFNFFRRELRPIKREILTSRLIDRSIRPLFPQGFHYDTQVTCSLMSVNPQQDQEVLSINGTSVALLLSGIPWNGPVGAVRVVLDSDGQIFVNPSKNGVYHNSLMNVIVACTEEKLIMVEGQGNECPEDKFCEAIEIGMQKAKKLASSLHNLKKSKSKEVKLMLPPEDLTQIINHNCSNQVLEIFSDFSHKKLSRDKELFSLRDHVANIVMDKGMNIDPSMINTVFWNSARHCMRRLVLDQGLRCDGRGMHEVRPISCGVDLFQSVHGSAGFLRGETQVVSMVTLDSPDHATMVDQMSILLGVDMLRNFMVHYDFPPYANNRTGRFMMPGRREIGHGGLAEKALEPLVPKNFPLTVRVNSTVTDSNGSSSMATVCGSSLALFDAGVSMSKAAAGVACGLILDPETDTHTPRYQVLSDITGIEDALGCMDFKVAGTRDGITACQIDVKDCSGLTYDIVRETVFNSKESRLKVLDIMDECQSTPRVTPKANGPAYEILDVDHSDRMKIIGSGGHKVKSLMDETGARIRTIEEGKMSVFAPSREILDVVKKKMEEAKNEIPPKERNLEFGAIYDCRLVDVRQYGFMVDLLPNNVRLLLHASRIGGGRAVYKDWKVDDIVKVKLISKDKATGRLQISHKAVLEAERQPMEEGEVYESVVTEKRPYGFMIDLLPSKTRALLHNSQVSHIPGTFDLNVGDKVKVKLIKYNNGQRLEVSRKALLALPTKEELAKTKVEVGKVYSACVDDIRSYGMMLSLEPSGIKTLLHSSRIDHEPGSPTTKNFNIGDKIEVKVLGQDKVSRRYIVSRKVLLDPPVLNKKNNMKRRESEQYPMSSYHVHSTDNDKFTKDLIFGRSYDVLITAAKRSGYIVEIPPGTGNTALLPATEIDKGHINPLKYKYKIGDKIDVIYYGKNPSTSKLIISHKMKSIRVKTQNTNIETSKVMLNGKDAKGAASITSTATSAVEVARPSSPPLHTSSNLVIEQDQEIDSNNKVNSESTSPQSLKERFKQYIRKIVKGI